MTKITQQNLALPKGGGAIKGIGEKSEVLEFSGSYNFSVPIAATPCRSIAPILDVSYSSGAGNSIFGLGWNLSLPKISRKTSINIPTYQSSDSFLFNDADDLVPLNSAPTSATINNTNYTVTQYYLRNEGSFFLINFYQNPTQSSDSFWQVIDRNHNVSIYGKSTLAKIADPNNSGHIFSWFLEEVYNDKGDHRILIYKAEDDGRGVNSYIEKIIYGCDSSISDSLILTNSALISDPTKWHFELIFDYGEYNLTATNPYQATQAWTLRPDPFSNFDAGFEIRTYRLCQNILMFHRFSELGANPILVEALSFSYGQNYSQITELQSITKTGYQFNGTSYTNLSLPPVEFSYISFAPTQASFSPLSNLNVFDEAKNYNFVDLFSEGIAGILYSENQGNYYSRAALQNNSNYNAATAVQALYSPTPATGNITLNYQNRQLLNTFPNAKSDEMTLGDICGDAKLDLMINEKNLHGFWQSNYDETWNKFQNFTNFPTDFDSAQQHFVDLTGSGLNDLAQIKNGSFNFYTSLGKDGFSAKKSVALAQNFPTNLASSPKKLTKFCNIDGSGASHLAVITPTSVSYWPNLGYGNFGAEIVMTNPPQFDENFDIKNLFLADLDGSGTADLIYFSANAATIYFNQNGNSFSNAVTLNLPIKYDDFVVVNFVDITGQGNDSLVLSDRKNSTAIRHYFYDFCQGKKPFLLNQICNNLGAQKQINYCSSVDFYLADKAAGFSWISTTPFPIQVVSQVTEIDQISNSQYVSQYAYHHAFYDSKEKEFRGFARVDRQDAQYYANENNANYCAPILSRNWFHNGFPNLLSALQTEFFAGDSAAFNFPYYATDFSQFDASDLYQAHQALAGMHLRSEVYGLDGNVNPFSVSMSNYNLNLLQAKGSNLFGVFLAQNQQNLNYDYERNPADPRINQSFNLSFDDYGNALTSCNIFYPRRQVNGALAQQQILKMTYQKNSFFNVSTPQNYLLGVTFESQAFEILNPTSPQNGAYIFSEITNLISAATTNLLSWQQIYYSQNNQPLTLGQAALPLLVDHQSVAEFSNTQIQNIFSAAVTNLNTQLAAGFYRLDSTSGYWWNDGLVQQYLPAANFYLPQKTLDQSANATTYEYDQYNLLLTTITDVLGNQIQTTDIDYQILYPDKIIDLNGVTTQAAFDPLGRVIYNSFYGVENGADVGFSPIQNAPTNIAQNSADVLANAKSFLGEMQSFFYYDDFAWKNNQTPPSVISVVPQSFPSEQSEDPALHITVTYNDGFGRLLQKKSNTEAGLAFYFEPSGSVATTPEMSQECWLTSGHKLYNNKGLIVKEYEPYYFNSAAYVDDIILNNFGFAKTNFYDPLNRLEKIITAKGFLVSYNFGVWQEQIFDENDTIKDSPYYQCNVENIDTTSIYYDANFASNQIEKNNLNYVAQYFYNTPSTNVFDNLGYKIVEQKISVSDQNPVAQTLSVTYVYDILGRILSAGDSRGLETFSMTYAMNSQVLQNISVDSGTNLMLENIYGNALLSVDSRGTTLLNQYDKMHRLISTSVISSELQLNQIVEKFVYGDDQSEIANPQNYNLRGRVYKHYDQAGLVTISSYGILGKNLTSRRAFLNDYTSEVNWNSDDFSTLLDLENLYTEQFSYDALGKIIQEVDVDGNIITPKYHQSGRLNQMVILTKDDGVTTNYVSAITYNANNQRQNITYGNDTTTSYEYDNKTDFVNSIITLNNSDESTLQSLQYFYDPRGNVIQKNDLAQAEIFYGGQKVSPNSSYEYNSIYQLISAQGRKQIGKKANDAINGAIPSLSDANALENYLEKYSYDVGGNLIEIQNISQNSSDSWTKNITVSNTSNKAVLSDITANLLPQNVDQFFDGCGNQIQANNNNQIFWNYRNNINKVILVERASGKNDCEYYIYDGSGGRVRKVLEQYADGETVLNISQTLYLGNIEIRSKSQGSGENYHVLKITDGAKNIADRNYWITGTPPAGIQNVAIFYILNDHLNSATTQVDVLGKIVTIEEFSPYGNSTILMGNGSANQLKNYRYCGREKDISGFYYYGLRYYSTESYRWLSPDPVGPVDGLNLYVFVKGNPITFVDIGGMVATSVADESDARKEIAKSALKSKSPIFKKHKNVHKSTLYTAVVEKEVAPDTSMGADKLMLRHLSTFLLSIDSNQTEVQAAVSHANKTIYVANNSDPGACLSSRITGQKFSELVEEFEDADSEDEDSDSDSDSDSDEDDDAPVSRVERHSEKLLAEVQNAKSKYANYTVQYVSGPSGQHAETKIVNHLGADGFDYVAGTRRPCIACSIFMQSQGVAASKFNQHMGSYWDANLALKSLIGVATAKIAEYFVKRAGKIKFYFNKGRTGKQRFDHDTDSESDE